MELMVLGIFLAPLLWDAASRNWLSSGDDLILLGVLSFVSSFKWKWTSKVLMKSNLRFHWCMFLLSLSAVVSGNFVSPPRELLSTNYDILSKFYVATSGTGWWTKTNWMSGAPCPSGAWYHVTCSGSDVVTISLFDKNLKGTIPSELGLLVTLTHLELGQNSFTGPLPTELGQLSVLTALSLRRNSIPGTVPSELGMLSNLVKLRLSTNKLSGSLPSELGLLSTLTQLSIPANSLPGSLPSEIGQLVSIVTLTFFSNFLTGKIPSEVGLLTSLTHLGLDVNSLRGSIPSQLGQLTKISQWFALFNNQISGSVPSQLGMLSLVSQFRLDTNILCGDIPAQVSALSSEVDSYSVADNALGTSCTPYTVLAKLYGSTGGATWSTNTNWMSRTWPCPSGGWYGVTCASSDVVSLSLSTNSLQGSVPSELGLLTKSTYFQLSVNTIAGSFPSEIGSLTSINYLKAFSNQFTGSVPSQLGLLTAATDFAFSTNNLVGSIPSQLGQMSQIQYYFNLEHNYLSGSIPSELGLLTEPTYFSVSSNVLCSNVPPQVLALSSIVTSYGVTTGNHIGTSCTPYTVLAKLYGSTGGATWSTNTNWMSRTWPCPSGGWYGVTCASSDVVSIDFLYNANNLDGTLPSELGSLSALTRLLAPRNSLSGSIPSELSRLSLLVNVGLYTNGLSGSLPSQLGLMSQLTHFSIDYNDLHGSLPSQLGHWTNIDAWLNFEGNYLSGSIPSELGLLTKTSQFHLSTNILCGDIPAQVSALSSEVDVFSVADNALGTSCTPYTVLAKLYGSTGGATWSTNTNWMSRTWPCPSGGWYAVTCTGADVGRFTLGTNSLAGTIPTEVGLLSKLSRFVVNTNQLTGTIPSQLGQLTNVFDMFLTSNDLTGSIPSQLGMLDIDGGYFSTSANSLTGSIPSQLGLLSKATTFRLNINTLCGDIPAQISALSGEIGTFSIVDNSLGTACCMTNPSTCSPTLSPTYSPTPSPTSPPSYVPTTVPSAPTVVPSPLPTVTCTSGHYFDGLNCKECAAGRYSSFVTAPYPSSCSLCGSGQYQSQAGQSSCTACDEGELSSPDRDRCTDCSAGEYAFNDTSCERCPTGQYAPQALSDNCLQCTAGAHTNLEAGATTCSACDAGKYSNGSVYLCTNCDRGYFSSFGATICTKCLDGYVAPANGSSSCTACSAGTFAPNNLKCTVCAKGRYQGSTAQTSCTQCDEGKYAPVEELTSCIACSAGSIALNTASSACTVCPLGTYQGSTGQKECVNCDEGKFASTNQSTSCSNCNAGKYSNISAWMCINCAKGKYSSSAASSCSSCPKGFFNSRAGAATCTACSAGTIASNTSSVNCTVCPLGTYQGSTGQSSCLDCDKGKYLPVEGSTSCIACSAGTIADAVASSACTVCPLGTYQGSTGQKECVNCDEGKFASTNQSTSCSNCDAGKYSNRSAWECTDCVEGKFSSSAASSCTSCAQGFFSGTAASSTCTSCNAGTYSNSSASICLVCVEGKFSANTASKCTDCPKGFYADTPGAETCTACAAGKFSSSLASSNCSSCEAGTYQGSTGQSVCVDCEEGKFASSKQTTSCSNCDAGKYSNASFSVCVNCPSGKFSANTASKCTDCPKGFYADGVGFDTCTACSAGTYDPNSSSSNCSSCEAGTYQGSTGQSVCVDCEEGKFASSKGMTSCSNCPTGYSSSAGSAGCSELAESGYFMDQSGVSHDCPSKATCSGGFEAPIPVEGYWVDHSSYEFAGEMYRCVRFTCLGGSSSSADRRLSTDTEDCWNRHQFNKTKCQDDTFQCREGAGGVLCGSCIDDYIYSAVDNACGPCGAVMNVAVIIIGGCLVSALLVALWMHNKLQSSVNANSRLKHLRSSVNTGSLKIIWVTYQIMVSVSFNLDVTFPSPFKRMQNWFSVFAFDFVSLECLNYGTNRYFFSVYIWAVFPLMVGVLIVFIGGMRYLVSKDGATIYNQHVYCFLFWSYIVLPPASNKQLQVFDCISLNSGERYLRVDTSVSCSSIEYKEFRGIIIASIVLYQSIPILWWSTLYDRRAELNPLTNGDKKSALYMRDNNPSLASLRFLFYDYKCGAWWFEIVDMYRRIIFIGILPLVSTKDVVRSSFGVILAIISLVLIREEQPYRDDFNNSLAYTAQISILVTFYSALSIETNSFMFKGTTLGIFLFAFNSLILVLAGHFAYKKYRKLRKQEAEKEKKAQKTEWACGFSEEKFKTTFASVWLHDIAPSHTMVFYYTTKALALQARRSGIPAKQQFKGVPLSLRSPYDAQENEFKVFNEGVSERLEFPNEEVLVLSLPMIFLDPLPGYAEDVGLCMISQDTLSALRPSTFTAVVDPMFWQDLNLIILPPQSIIRSFLIQETPKQKLGSTGGLRLFSGKDDRDAALFDDTIKDRSESEHKVVLRAIKTVLSYNIQLKRIRHRCSELKLVPLYHYTSISSAKLILKGGFRMSTQGQGDGGVYFSTQGPASYGFGSDKYEDNIIIDCFGPSRLKEYQGKGALDVVLVYGCQPSVLEQTPGGRANAKVVSKSTFEDFSLAYSDHNYFLRPDRIFGAFYMTSRTKKTKSSKSPLIEDARLSTAGLDEGDDKLSSLEENDAVDKDLIGEIQNDNKSVDKLIEAEAMSKQNYKRINPLKLKASELTAEEKNAVLELEKDLEDSEQEKKSTTTNRFHLPTSARGALPHNIHFPTVKRLSRQTNHTPDEPRQQTSPKGSSISFSPTPSTSTLSVELARTPSARQFTSDLPLGSLLDSPSSVHQ